MKKLTNRAISLLLVLVMSLSLFAGIDFTAYAQTVDYVYADGIIKNWGVRGTVATFLSQNAEAFYEDNGTSYEELSKLPGATATSAVPDSALFEELHSLMFDNINLWSSYQKQYDATRYQYQYTDVQNSGKTNTKISSFYSGVEVGPGWDGGQTWNREHTWPNSKGTGASSTSALREADIMMLRPAPSKENSSRGNKPYGESADYFYPNTGSFDVRGDVARILLYVYTCWGGHSDVAYHNGALDYMWGINGVIESKEVLLDWMEADPVDTWELGRNDSVESITGTRNVFVDFPELGFLLFNEQIPAGYTTPSGNAGNGTNYTITAVSGNTAYGTVSVSGKIITATPKTGYEVAGYTITSGSAEVVRDGNLFAVTAYSDVTVRINFQARSQSVLKLAEYGAVANSYTVYTGDQVTLPTVKNTPQSGHTFVGWVAAPTGDVTQLPTIYGVGAKFTVSKNQTLYALYSRLDSGATGTSELFEPYTGTLTEGDYIFVDKTGDPAAMEATATSKNRLQYQNVTFTGSNILSPNANIVWSVKKNGNYWTIYNASKKYYAGGTGTANQAKLLSSVTTYAQWTVQYKNSNTRYEFINLGNSNKGVNPMLRKNGEVGWACYALNTTAGSSLYLYKRVEGTLVYFTQIGEVACVHPNAYNVREVSPECDSVGYTAGVYCPDCKAYLSGHEEIPAINHANAYEEPGWEPTCTRPGGEPRLYCPDCDEYMEDEVLLPPTGHSYINGVCGACGDSLYDVLVLTADAQVSMELEEDLYVDLKGYSLTGTIVRNGFEVYGMDSATDEYTCENMGSFACVDENGDAIVPERVCAYGEKQYLAISDGESYSFHRFFVGITHMTLAPETVGLGYKTAVYGDEMVFAQLEAFSFRVQLKGYNPVYRHFASNELTSGEPITMRICNYDVENFSEHDLYAQVSLTLNDGTVIEAEEVALTFRWLTEQVNANYTDYTAQQLADFKAMLQQFDIVKKWDIPNLI